MRHEPGSLGHQLVHWYNVDHRHSSIGYVSSEQRHVGDDHAILAARHAPYTKARELNPSRWSGSTRNWSPIGTVTLNPERDAVVTAQMQADTQPLLHDRGDNYLDMRRLSPYRT